MPDLQAELMKRAQDSAYGSGNINLFTRPITRNPDGSHSSLYSMGFGDDKGEVLAPGVGEHGQGILKPQDAIKQYQQTGKYLGKFPSWQAGIDSSNMLAQYLHKEGEAGLTTPPMASSRKPVTREMGERLAGTMDWLLNRGR